MTHVTTRPPCFTASALLTCSLSPTYLSTTHLVTTPHYLRGPWPQDPDCAHTPSSSFQTPPPSKSFLGAMTSLLSGVKSFAGSCTKHPSHLCLRFLTWEMYLRLTANSALLCGVVSEHLSEAWSLSDERCHGQLLFFPPLPTSPSPLNQILLFPFLMFTRHVSP